MNTILMKVETKTMIRFWLVLLGIVATIFLLYKAATGLIMIAIAIFLALALRPLVYKMEKVFERVSRQNKKYKTLSAILSYIIIVAVVGAVLAIIAPVVIAETSKFVENLPSAFENSLGGWEGINNIGKNFGIENLQTEISSALSAFSSDLVGNLGATVVSGVGAVADTITKVALVLVLTLFFLLEGSEITNLIWKSLGSRKEDQKSVDAAHNTLSRMANVISTFVSRQILIAIFDGVATTIIVFILSFIFNFSQNLAIPMGLITMIFYLIPMFGQFIGGTLVTIVLAFSNPIAALTFAIVYITYTQIENNFILPKIQGNALKLSPVIVLSASIIGVYMGGLLGAIIAVPIAGCIRVLIEEYPNLKAANS